MGERQPLVDHQPLELGEHPLVGGVDGLVAVAGAGHDHADRGAAAFEVADLHRRGVGAEQFARAAVAVVRDPDRVPHVAGRVIGGDAQTVEVVALQFDIRPLDDVEAHVAEDALHRAAGDRDRVERALGLTAARQGDIDSRGFRRGVAAQGVEAGVVRGL